MNRNLLSLLGCSSSLALILLTVNSANANTTSSVKEIQKGNRQKMINTAFSPDEPEYAFQENFSDQLGELAINNLGCDCAGCRTTVRQMVEQGILNFPQ